MTPRQRTVANSLALAVLAELTIEALHPYEIGRRLTDHAKDRNFKYNRGSLYMVVSQLERAGFVTAQETVRDTQRPERTVYAVTEAGRAELFDWLHELMAEPRHEYPHFGVALSLLSIIPPKDGSALLRRRLEALSAEVEEIRANVRAATESGVVWVFLVEEDYRAAVLDAEIKFVNDVVASLDDPAYVKAWQKYFKERA